MILNPSSTLLRRAAPSTGLTVLMLALSGCFGGGGGDSPAPEQSPPVVEPPAATAPSITAQPVDASVTAGQAATFSVTAAGTAPLSYQWLRDGAPISGATAASYTVAATALADTGAKFSVQISNAAGSVTSAAATLTVGPLPSTAPGSAAISAGRLYGLALRTDGSVVMLGTGEGGMPQTQRTPLSTNVNIAVVTGIHAASIAAGADRALAVGLDGHLYGWGLDLAGTLGGQPINHAQATPRALDGVDDVTATVAAAAYSLALRRDGTVWHWPGRIGYSPESVVPLAVPGLNDARKLFGGKSSILDRRDAPMVLRADGSVWELSWSVQTAGTGQTHTGHATQVAGLADIVDVACTAHCLALRADGRVMAWGPNAQGQLGNGQSGSDVAVVTPLVVQQATAVPGVTVDLTGVRAVATTMLGSIAVMDDGRVFTWGAAYNGRGDVTDNPVLPTPLTLPRGSAAAVNVSCANQLCLLQLADGTLLTWGANGAGELGDGTTFTRDAPEVVQGLNLKVGGN